MSSVEEIARLEDELENAKKEYLDNTPWCCNKGCAFHKESATGNCTWSVKLEECREYEAE